jgi:hypothetical protein
MIREARYPTTAKTLRHAYCSTQPSESVHGHSNAAIVGASASCVGATRRMLEPAPLELIARPLSMEPLKSMRAISVHLIAGSALISAVALAKTIEIKASAARPRSTSSVKANAAIAADSRRLLRIFRRLHDGVQHGLTETRIASAVAGELAALGFEVRASADATRLVAILRNGPGPVLVYRTHTGASAKAVSAKHSQHDSAEQESSPRHTPLVGHRFGREANVAWLLGMAKAVVGMRGEWVGTLLLVSQPEPPLGNAEPSFTNKRGFAKKGKAPGGLPVPDMIITFGASSAPLGSMLSLHAMARPGSDAIDVAMSRMGVYEMPRYLDSAARGAAAAIRRSRLPEDVGFGYILVGIGDRRLSSEAPEVFEPEAWDESLAVPVDLAAIALGAEVATRAVLELLGKPSPRQGRGESREWTPHHY